jgi:hypothetical protein
MSSYTQEPAFYGRFDKPRQGHPDTHCGIRHPRTSATHSVTVEHGGIVGLKASYFDVQEHLVVPAVRLTVEIEGHRFQTIAGDVGQGLRSLALMLHCTFLDPQPA